VPDSGRSTAAITGAPADPAIAYGLQTGSGFRVSYSVGVMNADGSNQTSLVASNYAPHPAWSPDGHSIAYHPDAYGISRIDVSVVNGKPQASAPVVLPIGRESFDIAWSPDPLNDQIAYSEDGPVGSALGLWLAPAKPVTPYVQTRVYQSPPNQRMIWVAWNPQATRIAFIQRSISSPVDSLFIVDLTASPAPTSTFIRSFKRGVFGLSWSRTSPDRLALEYPTSTTSSGYQPSVLDLTTNTLSNVPSGGTAKWSPDDSRLVFVSTSRSGSNTIAVVTLSTGATVDLASGIEPEWRRNP